MAVVPSEMVACKVTRDPRGIGDSEDSGLVGFGHRNVFSSTASTGKGKG